MGGLVVGGVSWWGSGTSWGSGSSWGIWNWECISVDLGSLVVEGGTLVGLVSVSGEWQSRSLGVW